MKVKNKSMLFLAIGVIMCTSIGVFANSEIETKKTENNYPKNEIQGEEQLSHCVSQNFPQGCRT